MDGFVFAFNTPLQGINMYSPGLESTNMFFDMWLKTCEGSYGQQLPAMGPAREKTEKMMRGIPLFLNLYATWMDSISDFQNLSMVAMNRMQNKAAEISGEVGPEDYKELYNLWIETYSETFKEFLKSGHFAQDMGKFVSGFIEAQKYNQEMLEESYLKPMNLPTRIEIDELNKELYSLKKKVKELTAKIDELSENQ